MENPAMNHGFGNSALYVMVSLTGKTYDIVQPVFGTFYNTAWW